MHAVCPSCGRALRQKNMVVRESLEVFEGPRSVANYSVVCGMKNLEKEHFLCIYLDTRHRPIEAKVVSIGILNSSIAHPREVLKRAIELNCAAFICVHNHPSGDPRPSLEDHTLTEQLKDAGHLLGIQLLDHLIVAREGTFSIANEAMIG